jgi:hypothetical protein
MLCEASMDFSRTGYFQKRYVDGIASYAFAAPASMPGSLRVIMYKKWGFSKKERL